MSESLKLSTPLYNFKLQYVQRSVPPLRLWHDSLTGKTSVSRAGNFLVQVQVMSQNKIFGGRYVARN